MFAQKKKSLISGKIFAVIVIILFAAGYFINTYDFRGGKDDSLATQSGADQTMEENAAQANTQVSSDTQTDEVTSDTQLLMRIFDKITNTTKTQELMMPSEVIGKTFEEAKSILLSKYEDSTLREINESYVLLYKVIEKTPDTEIETGTEDVMQQETGQDQALAEKAGYYLIKEDEGLIKVYECDADGNLTLLRSTQISVHFLGDADQELFRYGVIKHTMDEVNELLQDFES